MKKALILLIRLYQLSRPLRPASCRFYPTCSAYSSACIEKFGVGKGLFLTAYRICRCHPFCDGGVDDPPEHFNEPFTELAEKSSTQVVRSTSRLKALFSSKPVAKSFVLNKRS